MCAPTGRSWPLWQLILAKLAFEKAELMSGRKINKQAGGSVSTARRRSHLARPQGIADMGNAETRYHFKGNAEELRLTLIEVKKRIVALPNHGDRREDQGRRRGEYDSLELMLHFLEHLEIEGVHMIKVPEAVAQQWQVELEDLVHRLAASCNTA